MTAGATRDDDVRQKRINDLLLQHEVEQFLYCEARCLDEERYRDWLQLMDPDVDYWAPLVQSRLREDPAARYVKTRMSHFQERYKDLDLRIRRYESPMAWAEDPPTRFCHAVSNIEVAAASEPQVILARSVLALHRNRNEAEQTQLVGRREDRLRRTPDGLKLLSRTVWIIQSVLLHKNINTFL